MSLQSRLLDLINAVGGDVKVLRGIVSTASTATLTPTSAAHQHQVTAQATALSVANPSGTWLDGQSLMLRIKDNGTAQAISWGSNYRAIGTGIVLPTTTVLGKTHYIGAKYNLADGKWDVLAVAQQT